MKAHETQNFSKVINNPWGVELAMKARGMTQSELAKQSGLSRKEVSQIIAGDIEASEDKIRRIGIALNYPPKFFQEWPDSKLEFGDNICMPKNIPIRYEDYKIMGSPTSKSKIIAFTPTYANKVDGKLF